MFSLRCLSGGLEADSIHEVIERVGDGDVRGIEAAESLGGGSSVRGEGAEPENFTAEAAEIAKTHQISLGQQNVRDGIFRASKLSASAFAV